MGRILRTSAFQTQASQYRTDTLNSKQYLVAPVVAIVAGVLNGELVPLEEISNGYPSWNGRPVTLDHPNVDGVYVTANHPKVWEQYVVGQLFNVDFAVDRLKGEVWIDVSLAGKSQDGRELLQRLREGLPIEVSTAYFRNLMPETGEVNGEWYEGIAHDLKPDHLAILLHSAGACSWADGCGVPRYNKREVRADMPYANEHSARLQDPKQYDEFRRENDKFGEGIDAIWGVSTNGEKHAQLQAIRFDADKFTPDAAKAWLEEHDYEPMAFEPAANEVRKNTVKETLDGFIAAMRDILGLNEASLEETWDAVTRAFYSLIESGQPVGEVGDGYVAKVYPDHIIVERADGRLFKIEYTNADSGVEFGAQSEVEVVYQPISNKEEEEVEAEDTEIGNPAELQPNENGAEGEEVEDELTDSESEIAEAEDESEAEDEEPEDAPEDETPEDAPEAPQSNEQSPCAQYVALVEFADERGGPDWALKVLQDSVAKAEQHRTSLIVRIVKNEANAFTAEELEEMGDGFLEKLAASLEAPVANYSGTPAQPQPTKPKEGKRTIQLPPLSG